MSITAADVPREVFRTAEGEAVRAWVVADMDGDGDEDVVLQGGSKIFVLRSRGDGTFRRALVTELRGPQDALGSRRTFALVAGDFDGDGDQDVAVQSRSAPTHGRLWRLLNDGSGRLAASGITQHAPLVERDRVFAFDTDGDGDDEIVTHQQRVLDFRFGRVRDEGLLAGSGVEIDRGGVADSDGDGDADVVIVEGGIEGGAFVSVLRNNGAAGFARELAAEFPDGRSFLMGAEFHDLNGDGAPEIIITGGSYNNQIDVTLMALLNTGGQFAGEPVLLYQETVASVRGRGGHNPVVIDDLTYYSASVRLMGMRDVGGDGRMDLVFRIDSGQSWPGRPPSNDDARFSETYEIGLVVGGEGPPGSMPTFQPLELGERDDDLLAVPRISIELDRDGRPDWLHVRDTSTIAQNEAVGALVYAELTTAPRPAAFDAQVFGSSWGGNGWRVPTGGLVRVRAAAAGAGGAGAASRVSVFIDSNRDGRLDAGDARITERSTPSPGGWWRFRMARRESWGTGLAMLFVVPEDAEGAAGVPATVRVNLV